MINDEENKNQVIDKLIEISKISYEQEMDRHKQLITKSDNLIKYITSVFVVVNIFMTFVISNKLINTHAVLIVYTLLFTPMIISLYFSIKVQKLREFKAFPTGDKVIELMKQNPTELGNIDNIKNKIVSYYSATADSLEKSNNEMATWLRNSHDIYLLSLVVVAISLIFIIA